MSEPPKLPVWQPLTFGGVASFARARWPRLLLLQSIVAAFVSVTVVVLLSRCWFPVLTQAVQGLNEFGTVRGGELGWPKGDAEVLAENHFLSLVVDLEASGSTGQTADLQIAFTRGRIRLASLFGYSSLPYPDGFEVELNRQSLDPSWNAWRPAFLFGGGLASALFLFASWFALATIYSLPIRVIAWLAGRSASLTKSWRVAAAALLPGALWMGGAVLLYATEQLSLVGLGVAFGFHFVFAWIYVVGAPFCLPRKDDDVLATGANPFTPTVGAAQPKTPVPPSEPDRNPFQSPPS